jgi:hypothetical protein
LYIWERGQGIPEGQAETEQQHERLCRYLMEPRPRVLTRIAEAFGVSVVAISNLAKRRNWEERAAAFDQYQRLYGPMNPPSTFRAKPAGEPEPDPPEPEEPPESQEDAAEVVEVVDDPRPTAPPPVAVFVDAMAIRSPADGAKPEVVLPLQRGSLQAQEEFRVAILGLGKRQLKAARGLSDAFVKMSSHCADLITRLTEISAKAKNDPDAPPEVLAGLQKLENAIENQLATATTTLHRLAQSSNQMGTQGRENWGQAVGIEAVLERLEAMLAMQEEMGYAEKTPAALPAGANQQQANDDHQ